MKNTMRFIFLFVLLSAIISCSKKNDAPIPPVPPVIEGDQMDKLVIQENFNFNTGKSVKIATTVKNTSNTPLQAVRVDVYAKNGSDKRLVQTFATDVNGYAEAYVAIPNYIDSIQFCPRYVGLPSDITVKIVGGIATLNYGKLKSNTVKRTKAATSPITFKIGSTIFRTLTGFDNNGVPTNLISPRDPIDASFLADINATLPDQQPVPTYNPQYLATSNETNVVLKELSDVWVTFVHEGAGNLNVLGYYKYNLSTPPRNKNAIDTIHIIFPNISYTGSGGGLTSGDKVYIGRFPANTGIGWVCLSDGFKNGTIVANNWKFDFYSDPEFNPEKSASLQQHTVLLYDNTRKKIILGFEDTNRENGSDNDFNDAIFYVTSNPVTAIETVNLPNMKYSADNSDTDKDGIPDTSDDYPNDASKAFDNYYPSYSTFGTMVFEDLWPSKGDYDLNDIVVGYRINQVTNATNKVVEVNGKLILKAMGASYHNGFGIALGIPSSAVKSTTTTFKNVTGSLVKHSKTTIEANGLETPVNNPYNNVSNEGVFVVFDDGYDILKYLGGGGGVNTVIGSPYSTPDTIYFKMEMEIPQNPSSMGNPPYNPFIFANGERSKEIHIQNMVPTGKVNSSLFMTNQDNTQPQNNKYYKTSKNLPWGILFFDNFDYPKEGTAIIDAYTFFATWAQSSGTSYTNWYIRSDGRVNSNIYSK